jgi:hypothetical protein
MNKVERFVAENINEMILIRLRRLSSSRLCRNVIAQTALSSEKGLSENVLRAKSEGMAWAVKSAIGYWETKSSNLNGRILSRYYAILQLSIAEQVGSPSPEDVLPAIQRHTELGHGLATFADNLEDFPISYYVACLNAGHFNSYCKFLGYDLATVRFQRRPRRYSDISPQDRKKIVSLSDLLRRIPELQPVIEEYLGETPLSFHVGHAIRNDVEDSRRMKEHIRETGQIISSPPREDGEKLTYIAIYNTTASQCPPEKILEYGLPFDRVWEEQDNLIKKPYLVGEFRHSAEGYWHDYLPTYKSSFCGTSIIVPLWDQISDPFIIHFITLYALSIVARYLPDLWHEIEEGDLDHLRSLFEHYLTVVDNILPRLALERLTRSRIRVDQPGSLWAPI